MPAVSQICELALEVSREVERAERLHPEFNSHHEAYAVILEELDEYKAEVWKKGSTRTLIDMRTELIQTAAMCLRAIRDLIDGRE